MSGIYKIFAFGRLQVSAPEAFLSRFVHLPTFGLLHEEMRQCPAPKIERLQRTSVAYPTLNAGVEGSSPSLSTNAGIKANSLKPLYSARPERWHTLVPPKWKSPYGLRATCDALPATTQGHVVLPLSAASRSAIARLPR
jgi:hypothetical protein